MRLVCSHVLLPGIRNRFCWNGGGPALIRFLYDDRAIGAGWILQVLAAGTWFLALESSNSTALFAGSEVLRYATSVVGVSTIGLREVRQDAMLTAVLVVTAIAGLIVGEGVHSLVVSSLPESPRPAAFIEGVAVFVVVSAGWGALHAIHRRRSRADLALP